MIVNMIFEIIIPYFTAFAAYYGVVGENRVRRLSDGASRITLSDAPYHVRIMINDEFQCSGALIDDNHVITVAHCVSEYVDIKSNLTNKKRLKLRVLVGSLNWRAGSLCKARRVSYHELFKVCNELECSYHTDIAIIKLQKAVQRSPLVYPIQLAMSYQEIYKESTVEISGFDITTQIYDNKSRLNIRRAPFQIMSPVDCDRALNTAKYEAIESNFCVHSNSQITRLSKGDDGAPVTSIRNGERVLVGIVSVPHLNCNRDVSVIVNVPYFQKLITYEQNYVVGGVEVVNEDVRTIGVNVDRDFAIPVRRIKNLNGRGVNPPPKKLRSN